ncbi:hypothetical protein [Streptomyces sp. NPDC053560]|uniref:hypothetical protein n=1 Tax=Streptomyces sp. NPDC053560 TaxID=3365711 RepID=UPI0037D578C8
MGDGAGIGPEVIVPAVLDPGTLGRCRPVVIGDAARLRKAAAILGTAFDIAGTGRTEAGSMIEALRQAAEMATAR